MKRVLILGATSDIGKSLAHIYAENGYSIIIAGRSIEKLQRIQSDLTIRYSQHVEVLIFDALDFEGHEKWYNNISDKPEVVISIFGYLGNQGVAQKDWLEARKIIESNYVGAASILNAAANDLEQKGTGTIIGISSVAGDRGRESNYFYGSAKAGFTAYLSGLRNRMYKKGVHVMTVKPGFVATKMIEGMDLPPKLVADPHKTAKAIYKKSGKGKNVLYYLPVWSLIMLIIKLIPEPIFKKLNL